jgi:hypothetical protein
MRQCNLSSSIWKDRFCIPVIRVPGYRSRGSGSIPRRYQILWEVADLERGQLSLVSTIEELLERKSSGSGLENRDYADYASSLYPQQLVLTSPTSGGRSFGTILSRTQATNDFFFCSVCVCVYIVSGETASRPKKRLMRTYHWISLFMSYIQSAN